MNCIHKTVIMEGEIKLGSGNQIKPYTILTGPLEIGDNNIIGPNVVVGSPGADTRNPYYDCSKSNIIIGNQNIIREFSSIQKPAYNANTVIKNHVYIMPNVHVQHDSIISNGAVLAASCVLAGLTNILDYAYLGMGATVVQYSVVGQYSIVATGASVVKHVKPFAKYIPGKPLSVNFYAIEKYEFTDYLAEITAYVLHNIDPTSEKIKRIIQQYKELTQNSKKLEYN